MGVMCSVYSGKTRVRVVKGLEQTLEMLAKELKLSCSSRNIALLLLFGNKIYV